MTGTKTLVLIVVVSLVAVVEMSQDVMKALAVNFAKPIEACKKELDLPDSVLKDFANFWREGFVLTDRNVGCAIICIASKLDLYDENYNIHHGNAQEFARKHGADDNMAKEVVDAIHNCMQAIPTETDACAYTVKVAQCFKNRIHELNWAPSPEVIMAELLAET